MAASNVPSNIYQFKIALLRIKPSIWRRIQVPEDYTFHQLHIAFQHAMGWSSTDHDYHLHLFAMKNPQTYEETTIGILDPYFPETLDEKETKISSYFSLGGIKKARYDYDFGAGWQHEVVLEKVLPAVANTEYPICLDGKRACPPEDGTLSDDEEYDPEKFDPRFE